MNQSTSERPKLLKLLFAFSLVSVWGYPENWSWKMAPRPQSGVANLGQGFLKKHHWGLFVQHAWAGHSSRFGGQRTFNSYFVVLSVSRKFASLFQWIFLSSVIREWHQQKQLVEICSKPASNSILEVSPSSNSTLGCISPQKCV